MHALIFSYRVKLRTLYTPFVDVFISFSDLMSQPVMTLLQVEKVGHIYDCLIGETFSGFPIIEQDPNVSKPINFQLVFAGQGEVSTSTKLLLSDDVGDYDRKITC